MTTTNGTDPSIMVLRYNRILYGNGTGQIIIICSNPDDSLKYTIEYEKTDMNGCMKIIPFLPSLETGKMNLLKIKIVAINWRVVTWSK